MIPIYWLTAIGLTPGGSSTLHIYTQTTHRTAQLIWEVWVPWHVFASFNLAFALQLRKKYGKTSVRVETPQSVENNNNNININNNNNNNFENKK